MRMGSSYVLNGFLALVVAGAVGVACGSDSQRRNARESAGGGGGEGGAPLGSQGGVAEPQPLAGMGGEAVTPSAGMGGAPQGMAGEPTAAAGVPQTPVGGEGGSLSGGEGGAGGEPVVALDCDVIVIQDLQLRQSLRDTIGKPEGDILPSDVAGLTALSSYDVHTLDGIGCLSDLTDLNLNTGGGPSTIADLTPLAPLAQLVTLDLSHTLPDSLEPLGKLPKLKTLHLRDAIRGTDLSPLSTSPSLEQLHLENNVLEDLSPLAAIATLRELSLDISTLNQPATANTLTNITMLSLSSTPLDLANLDNLTQLEQLYVGNHSPRVGLGSLTTLVNLTNLDIQSSGITSIAALASMKKLETLNMYLNDVVDISALSALPALTSLWMQQNDITNITPLVDNAGIGAGDVVQLVNNPLSCATESAKVATLVGRGATVYSNCN